jgi:hypothetical protein
MEPAGRRGDEQLGLWAAGPILLEPNSSFETALSLSYGRPARAKLRRLRRLWPLRHRF